ncbi:MULTISPECIES: helix-turn-helix domain-containing protein [Acinetobacter]|nr:MULTISPECIES: helix-turn-helix transcriptional regulator [Acinetobacter]MCU4395347.1 helix-turn-helix domain-containing protein [Acinetobacter parvus]
MSSLHDPRYRALIEKLIKLRESKVMTQVELASSLKKPQSYIAKVENFDRRIDIIELQDWLKALDTEIPIFFS